MIKFISGFMVGIVVAAGLIIGGLLFSYDGYYKESKKGDSFGVPTWIQSNTKRYNWSKVEYNKAWNGRLIGNICAYQENGKKSSTWRLVRDENGEYVKDDVWLYYDDIGLINQIESYGNGIIDSALTFNGDKGCIIHLYSDGQLVETVNLIESK